MPEKLITRLGDHPILGQSLGHVFLLRLDQMGGLAPGNKVFKLRTNLELARRQGLSRLVSFGGVWSNHLHAVAAVAFENGLESVGLVRGGELETPMLEDARSWGMKIVRMSREDYRRRNDSRFLEKIRREYQPCMLIPEGGANREGIRGCTEIARLIKEAGPGFNRIVLPVGTGTTLAGIVAGLGAGHEVVGISALKGAFDLEQRVDSALAQAGSKDCADWQILHDFHCGGFARVNAELQEFILAYEEIHGIPLDPVYTAKMLFAIHRMTARGEWDTNLPMLAIHTGGLQGRRGFDWLKPC
jgi:1-aminocyclopropane-1-carboxylate deaminase